MTGSLKRLWKDRRGNALAIAGAALPLIVGSAGLATDTIQWVTWKRQLQRAADSAALAGALAKSQDESVTANAAVNADLANNNHTPAALLSGYPQIAYPTSAGWENAVRVTLAAQKRLGFSSMFITTPPIIRTSATAAMVDDGVYCAWALRRDASAGITIAGNSQTSLGCKALSNSQGTPSVETNGVSYRFETTGVAGAGSLPSSIIGTNTGDLRPYRPQLPDPFDGLYPTDIPPSETCTNMQQKLDNATKTLSPGCYNSFHVTGNGTYTMLPGVYYLNSTDFNIGGEATVIGNGVTIILTGSDPGSIQTNGNTTIQLTAPLGGTYDKMLFIQAANADVGNNNTINGTASSKYDGAMYFPNGTVNFTGTAANMTKCAMVVGWQLQFSGNTNLQNDTNGCVAHKTVVGKVIRLVG